MSISTKYKIEQRYIRKGNARSGAKLVKGKPTFIVSHETANNSADADDHFNYFDKQQPRASAHTFIDDKKILEIVPLDEKAWHNWYNNPEDNIIFGDDANDTAVGVELCRPGNFKEAYDRYVWYHAYLCRKFKLDPIKKIVAHKKLDPRRRSDPESWLQPNGVTWAKFISDVKKYYDAWNVTPKSNQHQAPVKPKYTGLIKRGSTGSEVRLIQKAIGMTNREQDGKFGPKTEALVKKIQKKKGIKADGLVGPVTWGKIF